jgi:hypothetical protein
LPWGGLRCKDPAPRRGGKRIQCSPGMKAWREWGAGATGEQVLGLAIQKGFLDDDVNALTRLSQVSQTIRPLAKEHELGSPFHEEAVHQQQ